MSLTSREIDTLNGVDRGAIRRLAHAEHLRRSMPDYMRWAWPIDPSHPRALVWNFHLDAICDHLAACRVGDIRRLIINVPPRTLKSWTVSVAFPSWVWASDPSVQFLATSADKDVVFRDADMHRDLCKSAEYQKMFRPRWGFKSATDGSKQEAKGYYRNTAGGHRISKPIGAKGTGHNADYVIFDDPLDPADAYTDKAGLTQHVVYARQKFMTRFNDHATGVAILIMQRLHELDLSGVFLEDGGWSHLRLPAEYDGKRTWSGIDWEDPRTEIGELLFPERQPKKFLKEQEITLLSRGYAGQYQQQPAPAAGAMVLKDWLRYWTPGELPQFDCWWSSWDCSFGSKTPDASFVVGQVWGAAAIDNVLHAYLLDQVRRKMSVPEMLDAMREMDQLYPNMRAVVIELKAAGKHVITTLEKEIHGVVGFDVQGQSKQERLAAVLPMWQQGQILLPHPQLASSQQRDYSWVRTQYEPEILAFPGARHDDQVDATSQALIWIRDNGPGEITLKMIG